MTERIATLEMNHCGDEKLSPSDRLRLIGILSDRLRDELDQGTESIDMLSLAGLAQTSGKTSTSVGIWSRRASWDN